jgi:hypothetical protein
MLASVMFGAIALANFVVGIISILFSSSENDGSHTRVRAAKPTVGQKLRFISRETIMIITYTLNTRSQDAPVRLDLLYLRGQLVQPD